MISYYLNVLRKYAVFSGRAKRAEYWYFILLNILIVVVLWFFYIINADLVFMLGLYYLIIFIPSLAVLVRRLHDTGRSGWWFFISLVPLVGVIILLMFLLEDSQPDENKYGPNPKLV